MERMTDEELRRACGELLKGGPFKAESTFHRAIKGARADFELREFSSTWVFFGEDMSDYVHSVVYGEAVEASNAHAAHLLSNAVRDPSAPRDVWVLESGLVTNDREVGTRRR